MIAKEHVHPDGRIVLAVCDKEILGKKFEEGDKQLDLASLFYQGKEFEPEVIGDMMRNADSLNLVGEKAVKLGISEGIIDEHQILTISGIPYAQGSVEKPF